MDVEEAIRAIQAARAAARDRRWETAREQSEAALDLLAAGFLPDHDAEWTDGRRLELEELELEALEWVARSSIELGGPDLGPAGRAGRALIARAPYRETGYRFLMQALAADGNIAEALRVYERLRILLRDELGASPAAEMQELHKGLLTGEPSAPELPPPDAPERVPLPSLLSPRERSAFVGREQALAVLRTRWQDAGRGSRRLVLVSGEAGIGKTRLASELALEAHEQGTVLYAGCQEEALVPYQPIVEALRHYARSTGLDWTTVSLGPGGRELARLVPELAAALPPERVQQASDPELRRYLLFEAVSLFLSETSASAPLLLVLDDLHWADRATLQLLRHLLRTTHEARLLLVGTYRETDVRPGHPLSELVAEVHRDRGFERLSLEGLDESEVGALIASYAGHEASPGLVETVHEQTEGNPFFVEEVMRHLIETGVLYERGGRWVSARTLDEIGVPDGVREVLATRLGRLSEQCRAALVSAAVLGRTFSFDVLRPMSDLDEDALITALEEAIGAQLVVEERTGRPGPAFEFTHALVRETLYGGLSGPRRRSLHRRAAAALAQQHGLEPGQPLVEIVLHLLEAAPAGAYRDRAVSLAEQAAEWARAHDAYEQAVTLSTRALALVSGDDPERVRRLERTRAIAFQRLSHAAFDMDAPAG